MKKTFDLRFKFEKNVMVCFSNVYVQNKMAINEEDLFDKGHKEFHRKDANKNAWKTVAEELGFEESKNIWSTLYSKASLFIRLFIYYLFIYLFIRFILKQFNSSFYRWWCRKTIHMTERQIRPCKEVGKGRQQIKNIGKSHEKSPR